MVNVSKSLKLYFVMGSANCRMFDPEKTLAEAIKGGITLFQFREKGNKALKGNDCLYLGQKLRHLCEKNKIPFIVNDDIEMALELHADGVHIGQDDGDPYLTRKQIGQNMWLGISTHSVEEAQQAVKDGADYIGVGPMFPTNTKKDAHQVVGPDLIKKIRSSGLDHIPIVGIGGITLDRAKLVYQAGANGVAVISAISGADSPKHAAAAFYSLK
ncbi:thiamine phosphate synthase [Metabacillus schmidteae]|uniref:thiamine phosphate synthase n=1 Tax=Metabacillus schmidteae TaxID=2730405 RepID=UPI00158E5F37|nr:thiamine phosphate synthase [Metabacillus schmidteae]